jgi:hypothetical protein
MSSRALHSLIGAVIRIGLLLALVVMFMAERSQAQPTDFQHSCSPTGAVPQFVRPPHPSVRAVV